MFITEHKGINAWKNTNIILHEKPAPLIFPNHFLLSTGVRRKVMFPSIKQKKELWWWFGTLGFQHLALVSIFFNIFALLHLLKLSL